MPYDPIAIQPMREELTSVGVRELLTPDDVDSAVASSGTTLVVVNSVCGCAAGSARPAIGMALQHAVKPDHIVSVFAGQETEATQQLREVHLAGQPPSSPSMALFKDGKLIGMIHRHQIEGRMAREIAGALTNAFDTYCKVTTEETVTV